MKSWFRLPDIFSLHPAIDIHIELVETCQEIIGANVEVYQYRNKQFSVIEKTENWSIKELVKLQILKD